MELNIKENGKIIKTYKAETFTLTMGVCEDILKNIDIDKILNYQTISKDELAIEILKIVTKSFPSFKNVLMDMFSGLTEEEYRKASITDVAGAIFAAINHMISELNSIGGNKKK